MAEQAAKKHDVFLSYSTIDSDIAQMMLNVLERNGLKCWIAPRDIPNGADWADEIDSAIEASRAFVVIVSSNSIDSKQVPKEIALAVSSCEGIFPFRIDDSELRGRFRYYLTQYQFVDAVQGAEQKMQGLADSIRSSLNLGPYVAEEEKTDSPEEDAEAPMEGNDVPGENKEDSGSPGNGKGGRKKKKGTVRKEKEPQTAEQQNKGRKNKLIWLIIPAAALLIIGAVVWLVLSGDRTQPKAESIDAKTAAAYFSGSSDPSPLFGSWWLIYQENRGQSAPSFYNEQIGYSNIFRVAADGSVYDSLNELVHALNNNSTEKLIWSGDSINYPDIFKPKTRPETYSLSANCFFLDEFDETVPLEEGDAVCPAYSPMDPNLDFAELKYNDCFPDRYLVVHVFGTQQDSPVSVLSVDSWLVFQRDYPLLKSTSIPALLGEWDDNKGNLWSFWSSDNLVKFSLTDPSGTVYAGSSLFSSFNDAVDQNKSEYLSVYFDSFTMRSCKVVYFDGNRLYLLDELGEKIILTRRAANGQ